MKLLKIIANNFKLCDKNFTIDFIPTAKKTIEDKEYELLEIDEDLFVFNTLAFIGKNASGKTTAVELLSVVYDLFSNFKITISKSTFFEFEKAIKLDITFYDEGFLYRYLTDLTLSDANFIKLNNQKIYTRKYKKGLSKKLFEYEKYNEMIFSSKLPEDSSILFYVLNNISIRGLFWTCEEKAEEIFTPSFNIYKALDTKNKNIIPSILKMFDEHIKDIHMLNEDKFKIIYTNGIIKNLSSKEMFTILSSGTTKGIGLFTFVMFSLEKGIDLIIDEIENHFHKTLVENLISLYKDKRINKYNSSLIFTTHYCELLDLFNRSDNIYITKYTDKIKLQNIYRDYNARSELLKSKRFYQNAFGTSISYEHLMNFKENLL